MSAFFKKKVGNVYTDDHVADFFAACGILIVLGLIVWAMVEA